MKTAHCIVNLQFTDLLSSYAEIIGDILHPDRLGLEHYEDIPLIDNPQVRQQAGLLLERLAADNLLDLSNEPVALIKFLRDTLTEYFANAYCIRGAVEKIALTVPAYAEHFEPRSILLAALSCQIQRNGIHSIAHESSNTCPVELH